jgi:hypothetical protein
MPTQLAAEAEDQLLLVATAQRDQVEMVGQDILQI